MKTRYIMDFSIFQVEVGEAPAIFTKVGPYTIYSIAMMEHYE